MCVHVYLISLHMQIPYEYLSLQWKILHSNNYFFIIMHENFAKWVSLYKGSWLGIHESLIIRTVRRSGEAWRCTAETFGILWDWHCWSYMTAFWLTVRWSQEEGRNEKDPAGRHAPADCTVNFGTWREQRRRSDFHVLRKGCVSQKLQQTQAKLKQIFLDFARFNF